MKKLYLLIIVVGLLVIAAGYPLLSGLLGSKETVRCATLEGGISTLDILEDAAIDAKYGFDAEVIRLQKTPDILAAVAKGDVDIAIIPAEMAAKLLQDGVDIVIIAVDMYQNQAILAVKDDIKTVDDLVGKRVAAVLASGTYRMFKAYLKMAYNIEVTEDTGVNPNSVTAINSPPGVVITALERGDVDAIVIWEPLVSRALVKASAHVVADYDDMWRALGEEGSPAMLVWVARKDFVEANPGLVEKLVKARRDAAITWVEDEEYTVSVLEKLYGLEPEVAEKVYERVKINTDLLTNDLVENIRKVWGIAWAGGYLKDDPKWISETVFYRP